MVNNVNGFLSHFKIGSTASDKNSSTVVVVTVDKHENETKDSQVKVLSNPKRKSEGQQLPPSKKTNPSALQNIDEFYKLQTKTDLLEKNLKNTTDINDKLSSILNNELQQKKELVEAIGSLNHNTSLSNKEMISELENETKEMISETNTEILNLKDDMEDIKEKITQMFESLITLNNQSNGKIINYQSEIEKIKSTNITYLEMINKLFSENMIMQREIQELKKKQKEHDSLIEDNHRIKSSILALNNYVKGSQQNLLQNSSLPSIGKLQIPQNVQQQNTTKKKTSKQIDNPALNNLLEHLPKDKDF